jgi:hypothetical protein
VLGGPLYRLGCRLGLVRAGTNTVLLGVALGVSAWGVLIVLALLGGLGPRMFSLAVVGIHVRLLLVIPLLFFSEAWVVPEMAEFASYAVRSGVVPAGSVPAFASMVRRFNKLKASWLAELLFLLTAFTLPLLEMFLSAPIRTGSWVDMLRATGGRAMPASLWYLAFCLPLCRFLALRWLWHLGVWWYFLWRIERLDLELIPIHSDGAGGLGYLEVVHEQFTPLAVAISAFLAAVFAEELSSGAITFDTLYAFAPVVLLLIAALFIGPLLIFFRKLRSCRLKGVSKYMSMAARYVNAFDRKWIRDERQSGDSQLGTPDLQSLADLTNSVNVARGMHLIPVGRRLVIQMTVAAIVPLLPLLLLKYPLGQLAAQLFQILTGL